MISPSAIRAYHVYAEEKNLKIPAQPALFCIDNVLSCDVTICVIPGQARDLSVGATLVVALF